MPNVPIYVNYSTKKTIAQGMMDLALLTANASQLRYVLRSPYWDIYHKVNIGLISISIILQVTKLLIEAFERVAVLYVTGNLSFVGCCGNFIDIYRALRLQRSREP